MRFTKPSARRAAHSSPSQPCASTTTAESEPVRWSDVAASRKSTHPDIAPFKRVLDTFELCENVLKYVPLETLICLKRVCRSMNTVITTSPSLQTKLFLKAAPASDAWVIDASGKLLAGTKASDYANVAKDAGVARTRAYACNPLLLMKKYEDPDMGLLRRIERYNPNKLTYEQEIYLEPDMKRLLKSLSDTASCRGMLLSQPPVTTVKLEIKGRCDFPSSEDRRGLPKWHYGCISKPTITNERGVTMGELVDVIKRETKGYDTSLRHLLFPEGLGMSMEEKDFVEGAGEMSLDQDPWNSYGKAGKERMRRTRGV